MHKLSGLVSEMESGGKIGDFCVRRTNMLQGNVVGNMMMMMIDWMVMIKVREVKVIGKSDGVINGKGSNRHSGWQSCTLYTVCLFKTINLSLSIIL